MKFTINLIAFVLFLSLSYTPTFSQAYPEDYEYRSHTYDDKTIPYRLFRPETKGNKLYPLVTALHGIDDRGEDNEIQILGNRLAFSWSDSVNQAKWPCYVIAPQCPSNYRWYPYDSQSRELAIWDIVINMIDSLIYEFPIDTNRLYITGLSLGGYGTWHFVSEYPDKFAAAVPVCGGGDTTLVSRYLSLPVWNFHGENDYIVPVERSREMINAFEELGQEFVYTHCKDGNCTGLSTVEIDAAVENGVKHFYTEWEDGTHEIWDQSYDYPYLFPWVFSQSRDPNFVSVSRSEPKHLAQFELSGNYPNPFNPETTIEYTLNNPGYVTLKIMNISGQTVDTIVNVFQAAGSYKTTWQPRGLPSGLYLYRFAVNGNSVTRKMLFNK